LDPFGQVNIVLVFENKTKLNIFLKFFNHFNWFFLCFDFFWFSWFRKIKILDS
jgi:hypothetical protein